MRSRVGARAGGLPELVVEDSPAAADVALLEEQVVAAAIAATGLSEEQEFAIFGRDGGEPVAQCAAPPRRDVKMAVPAGVAQSVRAAES